MARSNRTGVTRAVPKQAVTPPSIPQSTVPKAAPMAPPAAAPMHQAPPTHAPAPAYAPQSHVPPPASAPMHAPPPAISMAPPPAAAPSGGGFISNFMGNVVSGVALGTGSAIANRAVDAVMGPRQMEVVHKDASPAAAAPAANSDACRYEFSSLQECMKSAGSDTSACQFAQDMFNQCKRQNGLSA
mmetsp:Transcript_81109/g.217919  ORF Transcript_81109/g.217919 Transcript_81109/m.217919 type:complete len:186 (-) Transcript_81109:389-946(-)